MWVRGQIRLFLTEIVGCMEALDIDILGLVETGLLQKDQGILQMALDPETHQVFQVASSNEGGAKVQGGIALVVSKKNGIAVEKIERDEKEGRWIRALVAIGGAEKCWVGVAYGVSGPCATREKLEHSTGVIQNWCEVIKEGLIETPNCIWMSDSNFIRDGAIDRKIREGNT